MRSGLSAAGLIALLLVGLPVSSSAQEKTTAHKPTENTKVLAGIKAINLAVSFPDPSFSTVVSAYSFTQEGFLQDDTWQFDTMLFHVRWPVAMVQALHKAGIRVFADWNTWNKQADVPTQEEKQALRDGLIPTLVFGCSAINTGINGGTYQYEFRLSLELKEATVLKRNPQIRLGEAITWQAYGSTIIHGNWHQLRDDVDSITEKFIKDYQAANPRK